MPEHPLEQEALSPPMAASSSTWKIYICPDCQGYSSRHSDMELRTCIGGEPHREPLVVMAVPLALLRAVEGERDLVSRDLRVAASVSRQREERTQTRVEQLEAALRAIRDTQGEVCDEYEVCTHRACRSSYSAWAIADEALAVPGPRSESVTGSPDPLPARTQTWDPFDPNVVRLTRSIAAHRKVNPDAYRGLGLRAVEEEAMRAALAAADASPVGPRTDESNGE